MHQPAGKHVGSTWCFQTGEQMSHPRAVAEVSRGLTPFMCSSAALGVRRGSHRDPARDGFTGVHWRGLKLAGQRKIVQVVSLPERTAKRVTRGQQDEHCLANVQTSEHIALTS